MKFLGINLLMIRVLFVVLGLALVATAAASKFGPPGA